MTLAEKIKALRHENKLTQKKLSELTGIAEITIRQYEAGKYNPKISNLEKLANVFHVPLSELIELSEDSDIYNLVTQIPSAEIVEKDEKKQIFLMNIHELQPFFSLNSRGRKRVIAYMKDLAKLQEYTEDKEPPSND